MSTDLAKPYAALRLSNHSWVMLPYNSIRGQQIHLAGRTCTQIGTLLQYMVLGLKIMRPVTRIDIQGRISTGHPAAFTYTGCCKINATMHKRHCTNTTRNKQKIVGTLQLCTHIVSYVATVHRFTAALICCTTFLAFQDLLFPPTLLYPNSHSPTPLQPKLCNFKEPSSYLPCSLVSTPHSQVCPCTSLSWAVCACGTPWGHACLQCQHAPHAINCCQLPTPARMGPPVHPSKP